MSMPEKPDFMPLGPFPAWPSYDQAVIQAVGEVLASGKVNYWTGNRVRTFQNDFAHFCGVSYGTAMANGTLALEAALWALGIGPGDEVVIPCYTYIASASAVARLGAVPVTADVDPESLNLTAETITPLLSDRTKAIMPVHLAGWPCEMDAILDLARAHELEVIEDCAQAHGAFYRDKGVGSMGTAAAFSFCQDKIISTGGEGGMVVTGDEEIWERVRSYKDHGKNIPLLAQHPPDHGYPWPHHEFGTNLRMTEMQGVIGSIQLQQLPQWAAQRKRNADALGQSLAHIAGLHITHPPDYMRHARYKYVLFVENTSLKEGWSRDRILHELQKSGIPAERGVCGMIQKEQAFARFPEVQALDTPHARAAWETVLVFPVHPTLNPDHMHLIADRLIEIMTLAVR